MEKVFITDKQGNKVLPKTHVSAVYDDEGNDLGSHLGAFEDEVRGLVDTPHQEYVTVATYASLPASGSEDTIYRVSNYNGSTSQVDTTSYSEYAWDGTQYIFLCVKSQIDEVFDITVYNNNTKYADLTAALGVDGANIPSSLRRGGMSVKFVQSSDNKYVQFRCMAQNFTTNVTQWQGVDEVPTAESKNLIESGGVYKKLIPLQSRMLKSPYKKVQHIQSSETVSTSGTRYSYLYNVKPGDTIIAQCTIEAGLFIGIWDKERNALIGNGPSALQRIQLDYTTDKVFATVEVAGVLRVGFKKSDNSAYTTEDIENVDENCDVSLYDDAIIPNSINNINEQLYHNFFGVFYSTGYVNADNTNHKFVIKKGNIVCKFGDDTFTIEKNTEIPYISTNRNINVLVLDKENNTFIIKGWAEYDKYDIVFATFYSSNGASTGTVSAFNSPSVETRINDKIIVGYNVKPAYCYSVTPIDIDTINKKFVWQSTISVLFEKSYVVIPAGELAFTSYTETSTRALALIVNSNNQLEIVRAANAINVPIILTFYRTGDSWGNFQHIEFSSMHYTIDGKTVLDLSKDYTDSLAILAYNEPLSVPLSGWWRKTIGDGAGSAQIGTTKKQYENSTTRICPQDLIPIDETIRKIHIHVNEGYKCGYYIFNKGLTENPRLSPPDPWWFTEDAVIDNIDYSVYGYFTFLIAFEDDSTITLTEENIAGVDITFDRKEDANDAIEKDRERIAQLEELTDKQSIRDYSFLSPYTKLSVEEKSDAFCGLFNNTTIVDSFLFFTDPHVFPLNWDNSKVALYISTIAKYYHRNPMSFILCGGDWLQNSQTRLQACSALGYIDSMLSYHFGENIHKVVGNHDTNYQGKATPESANYTGELQSNTLTNLWFRKEKSRNYTFDSPVAKYYVVDTMLDSGPNKTPTTEQWQNIHWFATKLLQDNDTHRALAMHIYYDCNDGVGYTYYFGRMTLPIMSVCNAFNNRESLTLNGQTYDFSNSVGKIEFVIAGHTHKDFIGIYKNIPVIVTTKTQAENTPTFDMCLVNYTSNFINLVRVGSGRSRKINTTPLSVSVGNNITLTTELSGTVTWGIFDETSNQNNPTTNYATINNGVVTGVSAGYSAAFARNDTNEEWFMIKIE